MTSYLFSLWWPYPCTYSVRQWSPFPARAFPPEGACEAVRPGRQPAREVAGGAVGKVRWRTVSAQAAVRDELRQPARELARKFPGFEAKGR